MKTFHEWYNDQFEDNVPSEIINGAWFVERGLPMVVCCTECGTTMALPNAYVDEDGHVYCSSCKE
jgi:hypothetical protein